MAKPAVHFKKFNEDWEKNKAAELFISITDKEHSELPVLSATQDFGMIKRDETGINIFHDIKNEEGYKRVLPGQFVIHLRSFQGGFAHSSIEGITSPAYTVFGFKEQNKHDDIFWKYIFSSEIFINRLRKVTYGIRDGRSISYDEFLTLKFSFPSKMEQTKIGAFFSTLDKLITLSQRKYDKLVNVKKVMLTKMFPRDGAKVPEIRFKGFADDWEEHKLGDESQEIIAGGDIDKNHISLTGKYPVLANALTNDGLIGYYNDSYRVQFPAVTVTGRGNVGQAKARKFNFTPVVRLLSIKSKHDVDFLENAINIHAVVIESTGVPQLTIPQLSNYTLSFPPKITEEHFIGNFFTNLDNLITLHQQKLEKLKNIKKACLEKMFV